MTKLRGMRSVFTGIGGLAAAAALTVLGLAAPAQAREPGVPPSMPPGATMGVPVAATPPEGLYFSSRSGFADFTLTDSSGNFAGADITLKDTAFQFLWVPGIKMFGGDYRALVTVPVLDIDQRLSAPLGSGRSSKLSFSGVEIRPLDISWQVAPGIFVATGFSVFTPGDWSASAPVNTGGNFWTFAPSVAVSYMRDGWNATLHAIYFTNTRNDTNDYKSGDELLVNATAMKDFGNFSLGPVGYYRRQLSADSNGGSAYGGTTAGKAEQLGLGLGLTKQIGKVSANVMYTRDVFHHNTLGGDHLWLNFTVPLGG